MEPDPGTSAPRQPHGQRMHVGGHAIDPIVLQYGSKHQLNAIFNPILKAIMNVKFA